jgi:hypothetical protein
MDWLLEAGFGSAYFASGSDLSTPIGEPEQEQRIFFVAQK